jgi:hypothetical protein
LSPVTAGTGFAAVAAGGDHSVSLEGFDDPALDPGSLAALFHDLRLFLDRAVDFAVHPPSGERCLGGGELGGIRKHHVVIAFLISLQILTHAASRSAFIWASGLPGELRAW